METYPFMHACTYLSLNNSPLGNVNVKGITILIRIIGNMYVRTYVQDCNVVHRVSLNYYIRLQLGASLPTCLTRRDERPTSNITI